MLIKIIEPVDRWKQLKLQIYQFIRLINNTVDFEGFSTLHLMLLHFLILFPFTSVLFKRHDYFPITFTNLFRIFLFNNFSSAFAISTSITYTVIIAVNLFISTTTALHFFFNSIFPVLTKLLAFTLKLLLYLIVPLVDLTVTGYLQMSDPKNELTLKLLPSAAFFSTLPTIAIILLTLKFELRMLRKNNVFWNLDNDIHFYGISYLIFKTIVITLTDVSVCLCLVSLVVWFYHRQDEGGCVGKPQKVIEYSIYNYLAAADISVLLYLLLQNSSVAVGLWIVLIICAVSQCILTIYRSRVDRLHLPNCQEPPESFYHFYYYYMQASAEDKKQMNASEKKYSNICKLHKVTCPSKYCYLSAGLDGIRNYDMEELVSRIISDKKNESMKNRVVYELWNLQLGKKCTVQALIGKPLDPNQEFIVYSVQQLTKDSQTTLKNSQSNKDIISKLFYDLIYEISSHYSQFYEQLGRSQPKIDLLLNQGTCLGSKIQKLKSAYSDLLKSKLINFKMSELYMEFLNNFVGENALDNDDVGRLMKAQRHIYFQNISESYLATLSLYPQTGTIENANSQAQKFLQSTRFQLKYKKISDITYPAISIDMLTQPLCEETIGAKEDPIYSFFVQPGKRYALANIVFQQKVVRQKKMMVVLMKSLKFSDQKNYFLVTSDFQLKIMIRKVVKLKSGGFRSHPIFMNWQDIYKQYIFPHAQKIINSKMLKIPTDNQQCLVVIKKLRCLIDNHVILEAQMLVGSELMRKKRNTIFLLHKCIQQRKFSESFQFNVGHNGQNQKLAFYGTRGENENNLYVDDRVTLTAEHKQLQNQLVASLIQENNREYGKDIKTYRLYEGELYNVDLEDRQAYNSMFGQHISQKKRTKVTDNSSLQFSIFVAVVLLGLALIALSLTSILTYKNASSSLSHQYSQFINIQSLIIDFNRILCLLRDHASGLLSKFPSYSFADEIEISFSRIQNLKTKPIFTNEQHTIQFQQLEISGNLIELIDTILAYVTSLISSGDMSIIQDIHNTCIGQINAMIKQAQAKIYEQVASQIQSLASFSSIVLYCSLTIVAILYCLMVFFCFQSNTHLKKLLANLLFISDGEANMHQSNAEKMKYAVEMIRKGFDLDSHNLIVVRQSQFKRRNNPKEAILSKEIVYLIIVMAVLGLAGHLACVLLSQSQLHAQLSRLQTIKQQIISTTTIYHTSAQLSNYISHKGTIDENMLNTIRGNLTYLQYNINELLFSPELNNFIFKFYFTNSCAISIQYHLLTAQECANTTPGFSVVNPFEMGLGIYLNRQNYHFYNNLTQTYAYSGLHSKHFAAILTNLTQYYKVDMLGMIGEIAVSTNLFNGFIIAIDLAYILAFVVIKYYFRQQIIKIKEIMIFFEQKFKAPIVITEQKQEIQIRPQDSSSDEQSSQEQRALLEKSNQSNKNNLKVTFADKRRVSIELVKPFSQQHQE